MGGSTPCLVWWDSRDSMSPGGSGSIFLVFDRCPTLQRASISQVLSEPISLPCLLGSLSGPFKDLKQWFGTHSLLPDSQLTFLSLLLIGKLLVSFSAQLWVSWNHCLPSLSWKYKMTLVPSTSQIPAPFPCSASLGQHLQHCNITVGLPFCIITPCALCFVHFGKLRAQHRAWHRAVSQSMFLNEWPGFLAIASGCTSEFSFQPHFLPQGWNLFLKHWPGLPLVADPSCRVFRSKYCDILLPLPDHSQPCATQQPFPLFQVWNQCVIGHKGTSWKNMGERVQIYLHYLKYGSK